MKIIGFTVNLTPKENEDAFFYKQEGSRAIACIADGITRDPIGIPLLPDKNDEKGMQEALEKYPRPSHARKAAGLFCKSFFEFVKPGKARFDKAFEFSNLRIKALNKQFKLGSDFLEHDYAGCVAVGVEVSRGILSWGFLTDCGLAVFNNKGLKFRTENMMKNTDEYVKKVYKKEGKNWKNPEMREFVRGELRNKEVFENPSLESDSSSEFDNSEGNRDSKEKGKQVGYGAFTGEEAALNFLITGKYKVFPKDCLFLYSDGMEPIIYSKDFAENLKKYGFNGLQRFCRMEAERLKVSEGSLVAIEV